MGTPKGFWECPQCGDYIEDARTVCPRCGKRENVSHYKNYYATEVISNKQEMEKYVLEPSNAGGGSVAAIFMKIIAWVLWIGGLIIAIVSANVEIGDYYTYTKFSWLLFWEIFIAFGILGGFSMCASELFENVARIANSLQNMTLTKK